MAERHTIKTPVALIILDGFGYRKDREYNAIAQAKTPHLDAWFSAISSHPSAGIRNRGRPP